MFDITGQIFVRDSSTPSPANDGRTLIMIVGVLAVPESFPLQGEHQYVVGGQQFPDSDYIQLSITGPGKDLTETSIRMTLGQLVLEPIWRF